jgi:vacuolar-type H+-ATPase subunit F/Vma7
MKIVAVSDEDTNSLFQLIGIDAITINTSSAAEFKTEFNKILEKPDVGLIIVNDQYFVRYADYFKELKYRNTPLIVEVPGLHGTLNPDYFESVVKKMLGLEVLTKGY